MFSHKSGSVSSHDNTAGEPLAMGVLWTPADARHRRIPPRTLLPGNRRGGGAHRRARHGGQHAAPSGLTAFLVGFVGVAIECP